MKLQRRVLGGGNRFRVRLRAGVIALLALFVFTIPFENAIEIPGIGSLTRLIGLLAFIAGIVALRRRGDVTAHAPALFLLPACLLVVWGLCSAFWSVAPIATLGRVATFTQLVLMAWLVVEYARGPRVQALLLQAFVLGGYLNVAVAVNVLATSQGEAFRDVGSAFNPNGFAAVLAIAVPFAWHLGSTARRRWLQALNYLFIPVAVFGVVLSASRGGLIAMLAALVIVPLGLASVGWLRRIVLIALIAIGGWIVLVKAPQVVPDLQRNIVRLAGTYDELTSGSLTTRREIWRAGLTVFTDVPLTGVGFGAFRYAVADTLGRVKAAHNAFVTMLVELGVVGLVLFVAVLAISALSVLATASRGLMFAPVAFLVLAVTLMPSNSEADKYTWFVLAILNSMSPIVVVPGGSWRRPIADFASMVISINEATGTRE